MFVVGARLGRLLRAAASIPPGHSGAYQFQPDILAINTYEAVLMGTSDTKPAFGAGELAKRAWTGSARSIRQQSRNDSARIIRPPGGARRSNYLAD